MGDKKPKAEQAASEVALTPVQNRMLSYAEIEQIGKAFVASGMFGRDVDRTSKAITKIMAGQELGMAPFAAMRAVHVIDGNATLSANTMAAMVKRSGKYDYTVDKKTAEVCQITFYEIRNGKRYSIGVETFDKAEAHTAGLMNKTNWRNYPKAMLFARCMSNGVRTYCPDVFSGMLVYTPDELGGKVDDSGHYTGDLDKVIDIDPQTNDVKEPAPDPTPEPETEVEETPEVEPEPVEQPIDVTDEYRDHVQEMITSLGLKTIAVNRLLKQVTGKITTKALSDQQWRDLGTFVTNVLAGEETIPDDWLVGVITDEDATDETGN